MGAICTCTENIQVLEIQEFHLPTFALKMLHALKVWAKIRLAGKKHNFFLKVLIFSEEIQTFLNQTQSDFLDKQLQGELKRMAPL